LEKSNTNAEKVPKQSRQPIKAVTQEEQK
jgi:hypothetical protein